MENKNTEDCYFFLNGYCSKGDGCEFRHLEGVKDRPLCVNWLLEKCNDPNCPNRHPTLPRQKDGSRTVCFYNQACTRPDCPFFHAGTVASPATPRPDRESELTSGLTPRGDANKTTTVTTSPTTTVSPVMKTAIAARLASGPVRPQRKKGMALPELPPRDRLSGDGGADNGAKEGGAAKQSFVKSFEEILKEKEGQTKDVKPEPKKPKSEVISNTGKRAPLQQSEKAKPAKSARPQLPQMTSQRMSSNDQTKKAGDATNGRQRGGQRQNNSGPSAQAPAARPSFGVKSLDELMKEGANKQATASAAGAKETGVKRPREESAAMTKALPQPQQKQQRAEPVVAAATEDDEFERELEEIGIDDVNGTAEPFDDDELNELLAE